MASLLEVLSEVKVKVNTPCASSHMVDKAAIQLKKDGPSGHWEGNHSMHSYVVLRLQSITTGPDCYLSCDLACCCLESSPSSPCASTFTVARCELHQHHIEHLHTVPICLWFTSCCAVHTTFYQAL